MKKLLAILLSAVMLISTFAPASYAFADDDNDDYSVYEATVNFLNIFKPLVKAYEIIFGNSFVDMNFEEGAITELCGYILDNSGLDVTGLIEKIPVKASAAELLFKATNADTTAIRESLYEIRDKLYEDGNSTAAVIMHFIAAYISVVESAEIYTVPADDGENVRVAVDAVFMDGNKETIVTDIYFSPDGYAFGPDGAGIQLLGFECSVYDLMIYATVNCWMRDFGFCFFYDLFCYTTPFFNYETRRFKFDYDGKEWMVQAWKGNYLISNGAEVGIYNREEERVGTFYDCYDSTLPMTLKLSHGDDIIYDIEKEHWWINGFKLGKEIYAPDELKLEFSVSMPNIEMAQALAEAINNHYKQDVTCSLSENTVSVIW